MKNRNRECKPGPTPTKRAKGWGGVLVPGGSAGFVRGKPTDTPRPELRGRKPVRTRVKSQAFGTGNPAGWTGENGSRRY